MTRGLWLGATALTTPMCCAPGGRPAPWAARSRRAPSCAASGGAGPGDAPFTIDLDSTICETYGLAKEGARHHGYTGKRGYHPLLASPPAGGADVPAARGPGQQPTLRETVGLRRGQRTNTGDSCVSQDIRPSGYLCIPDADWISPHGAADGVFAYCAQGDHTGSPLSPLGPLRPTAPGWPSRRWPTRLDATRRGRPACIFRIAAFCESRPLSQKAS